MINYRDFSSRDRTMKLAEQCFVIMERNDICTENFVEWLFAIGINSKDVVAESSSWLEIEMSLNEAGFAYNMGAGLRKAGQTVAGIAQRAGQAIGTGIQNVRTAMTPQPNPQPNPATAELAAQPEQSIHGLSVKVKKSLEDLFKRGSRGGILGSKDVQDALSGLIQKLNQYEAQLKVAQPKVAQPAQPARPAPFSPGLPLNPKDAEAQRQEADRKARASAGPDVGSAEWGSVNHIGKRLTETRIREFCELLHESGVDPSKFVDWYISEGSYLNESEGISAGLSGIWGGLGSMAKRAFGGGDGSWGDAFQSGYRSSSSDKYRQYDLKSIDAAVKDLNQLSQHLGGTELDNLSNDIESLSTMLVNSKTPAVPQPEQPEQGSEEGGVEVPDEEAKPGMDMGALGAYAKEQHQKKPVAQKALDRLQSVVYGKAGDGSDGDFSGFDKPAEAKDYFMKHFSKKAADHLHFAKFLRMFTHKEQDANESVMARLFEKKIKSGWFF